MRQRSTCDFLRKKQQMKTEKFLKYPMKWTSVWLFFCSSFKFYKVELEEKLRNPSMTAMKIEVNSFNPLDYKLKNVTCSSVLYNKIPLALTILLGFTWPALRYFLITYLSNIYSVCSKFFLGNSLFLVSKIWTISVIVNTNWSFQFFLLEK